MWPRLRDQGCSSVQRAHIGPTVGDVVIAVALAMLLEVDGLVKHASTSYALIDHRSRYMSLTKTWDVY